MANKKTDTQATKKTNTENKNILSKKKKNSLNKNKTKTVLSKKSPPEPPKKKEYEGVTEISQIARKKNKEAITKKGAAKQLGKDGKGGVVVDKNDIHIVGKDGKPLQLAPGKPIWMYGDDQLDKAGYIKSMDEYVDLQGNVEKIDSIPTPDDYVLWKNGAGSNDELFDMTLKGYGGKNPTVLDAIKSMKKGIE